LGIIEKRKTDYSVAEEFFQTALDRLRRGQKFIISLDEAAILDEIGMMRDGQQRFIDAIDAFKESAKKARVDSYQEADAKYEIPRLSLKIWLMHSDEEHFPFLLAAIDGFENWIRRTWSKITTKMWARYHLVCALRQLERFDASRGLATPSNLADKIDRHKRAFILEADSLTASGNCQL
jgi:hypothetical protein